MCRLRLNYREEGETDILPVRDWKEVQQTYKCFLNQDGDGDGDGLPAEVERRQNMSGSSDSYRASWLLIVTKTEFWVRQTQLASGGKPWEETNNNFHWKVGAIQLERKREGASPFSLSRPILLSGWRAQPWRSPLRPSATCSPWCCVPLSSSLSYGRWVALCTLEPWHTLQLKRALQTYTLRPTQADKHIHLHTVVQHRQ